jgi:hypothetical protein
MNELPTIPSKNNITFEEAISEYGYLKALLNQNTGFPGGGTGWSSWFSAKIEQRLSFVKDTICDAVCKQSTISKELAKYE